MRAGLLILPWVGLRGSRGDIMTHATSRRVARLADRIGDELIVALAMVAFDYPESRNVIHAFRHRLREAIVDRVRQPHVARDLVRALRSMEDDEKP